MGKRRTGFNTPFADLDRRVRPDAAPEGGNEGGERTPAREARPAARRAPPDAVEPDPVEPSAETDAELFRAAVGDARPVDRRGKRRVTAPPRAAPRIDDDEDAEVLAVLSDLVAGEGHFDVADTHEYVEGLAPGVDRRLLARLKRGDFSVQAHLDLHGLLQEPARLAVRRFFADARARGLRCVLVIHGRGRNSPGKEPVLKRALVRWLSRGRLGKQVLAFTTARPHDGGGGAVYVLLRR